MLLLPILWFLILLAGAAGWQAGKLPKGVATICAGFFCAILVAGAALAQNASRIPEWMISPIAGYLQSSWFAPPAIALFLIGGRQAIIKAAQEGKPDSTNRTLLLLKALAIVAAASATGLAMDQLGWYSGVPADLQASNVDENGVVRQTSMYTCGPSAAATLLRKMGIQPDATEAQLAPLCMTRRRDGATTLGIAIGLKTLAAPSGWRVRIVETDWEEFRRLKKPVLAAMNEHALVVMQTDPAKGVQVADPMSGMYWRTTSEFRAHFGNIAICVYRDTYE